MKRMVIPFLATLLFFMSSIDKAQAITLDKPHDYSCATCHAPHKTEGSTGYNNICLNCHRGGDPMAGAKSFAPGDAADPFNKYASGVSNRYQISHRWDGVDVSARAGATAPTQAQMTSVRGRTSGALACVRCHNPHSQANKPFLRTANSTDQMCTDCHSSRNQTDHKTGTHPVGVAYSAFTTLSAFKATPENANPTNPSSAMKLVDGKILCSTCHGVHATDSNSATFDSFSTLSDLKPSVEGNMLRTDRRAATADGINICSNCHAKKAAHNGRGQNIQCADCHGAHVDTGDGSVPNVWLVKPDMGVNSMGVKRGAVQFTSTSVTTKNYMGKTTSNGVCQSCHAVPIGAGFQFHASETNATCNNCHKHSNSKGSFSVDASSACNACHGYPPLLNSAGSGGYAAGYNATSSFVDESTSGHVSHVSTPYQKACMNCHTGSNHADGIYQDVFNVSTGTVAATGGLTPAYNRSTQSCSNVYCHSDARGNTKSVPSWKDAKGKIIGCGACHNAAGNSSPSWSAPHTRHINDYVANTNFTCNACHAKTASSNSAIFSNMTARSLHTNAVKDVAFNSFAGGGSWDSDSATCSNLYCHSNVQGANGTGVPTSTSVTWNSAPMTCSSCHASMTTDIPSVTGNHKLHVQGYGFNCSTCHGAGYSAAGNAVPAATHVDGTITMSLTGIAAKNNATPSYYQTTNLPGNGYDKCSSVYCHSDVQGKNGAGVGAPAKFTDPTWGGAPLVCGSCHANMATSSAATGSHKPHAQKALISCVICHNGAGKDPNPPYAATAKHSDGSIDIAFSGAATGAVYSKTTPVAPGNGYGSCTNASCHANPYSTTATIPTPVWGVSAGCGACHSGSGAFSTYSAPNTGSHAVHMVGTAVQCNQCHAGAVKGLNGGSNHIDGNIDVTNGYPTNVTKHTAGTYPGGTCTTAVCHSNPYSAAQAVSPVWGTPAGCGSCHNGGGAFSGTGGGPATGSHNKHMAATALPVSCGDCHSGAIAGINGGSAHANGVVNITQGYYSSAVIKHAAGTYAANATCSTTCHSPFTTPVKTPAWNAASDCSSCHESAPTTGSHPTHSGFIAVCVNCHVNTDPSTNTAGTNHFNGTIDVLNGYPSNVAKHAAATYSGTCSTASCHPDPYGTGSAVTPVWGTESGCSACHTTPIGVNGPATGSHNAHAGSLCTSCHNAGTTMTSSPSINHKNGSINITNGYPLTAKHAANTGYTGTCSTASCHANVYGTGNSVTPVWGTVSGCSACHTVAIGENGPATGSHNAHAGTTCVTCHNPGTTATTAPTANHADGSINVTNGYPVTAKHAANTGYTGTCNTASCHSNPYGTGSSVTPVWGAVSGCNACHNAFPIGTNGPATGSHAAHAGSSCVSCHNAGTTATSSPSTLHADGSINVTNGYPVTTKHAANSGYTGTCNTASCHSNPYGTGTTVTPVWGVAAGCSACHSGAGAIASTGPATGSHVAHNNTNCALCHATASNSTTAPTANHADNNINVINGYPATVAKHTINTGYTGTCSTASCHSNPYGTGTITTPVWGVAAGCTACHSGTGAIASTGPATGSHVAHNNTNCALCHATASNSTTAPTANHADNNINVINGYPATVAKHTINTGYTGTCSTASCHSNPYGTGTITTPVWGVAAGCTACHSGTGAIASTGPATGSHVAHNNTNCALCHATALNSTTAPTANHADNNINVINGYPATVAKHTINTGYTGTCSTASCHLNPYGTGTITTPIWGVAAGCAACHSGTGAIASTGPATGSHVAHNNTNCALCHATASNSTTAPTANHADNNINVINGYPATVAKHTINTGYTGTCSTASCHSNPYGTGTITTPVWGVAAGCTACHSGTGAIASTGPATGSHVAHNNTNCALCHATASNSTTAPTANHADNNINVINGYPATVAKHTINTGYTGTCSTASCHSNPYGTGTSTTPVWGAVSGCNACHNAFPIGTNGPATGGHVLAGHQVACITCHLAGTTATTVPGTNHGDTLINVANVGYVAGTAVAKHAAGSGYSQCNNASCHGNPYAAGSAVTPTWSGTSTGCAACHVTYPITANGPATGGHVLAGHQVACITCHLAGTTATTVPGTNHGDTLINVANVGYVAGTAVAKHAAGSGYSQCNNASCHGDPYAAGSVVTPTWSGTSTGCSACHAAYPITASGPATGSHASHAGAACISCHNAGTTATTAPITAHGDGDIDVTSGYAANVAKHTPASGFGGRTCSAATCHAPYSASGSTPVWGQVAGCEACHLGVGAFINYSAPTAPNIAIPQQNGPNTGSHSAHMNYGRYVCQECHDGAVTGTSGGLSHANTLVNVTGAQGGGYGATAAGTPVAKHPAGSGYLTCTTACHTTSVPTWGQINLGCINCHAASIVRTKGRPGKTLAAVMGEFGLAAGHRKTPRTAVTDSECIACHLEGNGTTHKTSKFHADGNIDLRDPDALATDANKGETAITNLSGGAFTFQRFSTSYAAGSRTATGATNNADIAQVISVMFCVKCHDANGAQNTTAYTTGGTNAMPFGGIQLGATYTAANNAVGTQGLINVATQFAITNSTRHPVLGSRTRDFPYSTRLAAPYNNIGTGRNANGTTAHATAASVVMNCFDCHNTSGTPLTLRTVAAHGNAQVPATGYVTLRGTVYDSATTLCTTCHTGYTNASTHAAGSAWAATGSSHNVSNTCHGCHGSNTAATAPARPIRAQDYHGSNALVGGGLWPTINARPVAFIRGWSGGAYHKAYSLAGTSGYAAGAAVCGGGTCPTDGQVGDNNTGATRNYTAGGSY